MKIAIASLFAASAAARRLDQNQNQYNQAQEYDESSFLQNYEQVFLKCVPNMKVMNEDGEYDYNAVVYRMCPTGNACNDGKVCDSGYGDYVVGLQTYVRQFFDQFEDEDNYNNNNQQQGDDAYDFGEFGECRELNVEAQQDDANGNQNQVQYYMGPACTEDGDVRMALYVDEYCRPEYEANVQLEDLIGIEMPYQDGGLMDDDECKAYYCWAANDNGEYELNKFCEELYMNSAYKCEQEMEYVSAVNGMNNRGCEVVAELMPQPSGNGGTIFLVILLIAAVVGVAVYFVMQQQKKKQGASEGLMM